MDPQESKSPTPVSTQEHPKIRPQKCDTFVMALSSETCIVKKAPAWGAGHATKGCQQALLSNANVDVPVQDSPGALLGSTRDG